VGRLHSVLEQEGLSAHEDALRLIGRKADGGMRDALSVLDQVLSLTGGALDADAVRRVLGLVEEERYLELLDLLADRRHGEVFDFVERLLDEGYDLVEFYHGLMESLRFVLRLKLNPDASLDAPEELKRAFVERAARFAAGDLVRMLSAAADLESNGSMRRSANARVLVEMLLLRLSYLDRTVEIEELLRAMGGAPASRGGAGSPAVASSGGPEARPSPLPKKASASQSVGGATTSKPTDGAAPAWREWLEPGPDSPERNSLPSTPAARITREVVRNDTLKALYRKEPRLEQAVQDLDLELME
jgi:DNA polymerase-3 subunit gamma/tau